MKALLITISILLATMLNAQEVRIFTTGQYKVMKTDARSGDAEAYARNRALISAKQKAIEQAGTTLYSSMYIKTSQKKETAISKIEAISAGIIRTTILEESFENNLYKIRIEASIEVASVEAVFNKADKRLKKITKLQKDNVEISKKLTALTVEMAKILAHSSSYDIDEPRVIFDKQEKLLDAYEKNTKKIKVKFTKGTLAQIATNNMIRDENRLEVLKRDWDEEFTKPYIDSTSITVHNVNPIRNGRYVDLEFILSIRQKQNMNTVGIDSLIQNRKFNDRKYKAVDKAYFKHNSDSKLLLEWIDRYRNMAVVITVGKKRYMTELIVTSHFSEDNDMNYSAGMFGKMDRMMGNVYDWRVEFLNTRIYLTHRKILNIPIEELESVDSISAELVMVDADYVDCGKRRGGDCVYWGSNRKYTYLSNGGSAKKYYVSFWKKLRKAQ